jgi:subtilisin family serine protease
MKKGRFLCIAIFILIGLIVLAVQGRDLAEIKRPRVISSGTTRPKVTWPRNTLSVVRESSVTLNVLSTVQSTVAGSVTATDLRDLPLTFSITTLPNYGTASIDPSVGTFTYSIVGPPQATSDSFKVTVSNGSAQSTAQVIVNIATDPLFQNQWHIQNIGQNAFASIRPISGNDMNVTGAWIAGYSGKGIKVGVVDTGLEAAHEDLAANVDMDHSFNFVTLLNDPSPAFADFGFDHGTAVAGIIGAVAFNGKGGRGVAYDARLRGYNLLSSFSIANMAKSMGSNPISADNDLFNVSFGSTSAALPSFSGAYQSIAVTSAALRNGLGAAIVNAAGNDFEDWEYYYEPGRCDAANLFNVSCGNPANDERRAGYTPIIVGAIDADGKHASYSSTGSSLWISAPAGEYGYNSDYDLGNYNYAPAIITTSRTGCANSNHSFAVNPLDSLGAHSKARECQYTATMNGTSAATPNVAGVVAMMLEANPDLSVRDLKHILARTAKKTDPSFSGVSSNDIIPGSTVVLEQGWVTNGAGWSFSERYGFGAVDATAAVTMAKTYTDYLPPEQDSQNYMLYAAEPGIVPPFSTTGSSLVAQASEPFSTVESVIVFLNIDSTPGGLICNQVELKSPSGTKSILMHVANGFTNSSVVNSRILSNAFYGESVNGNWTLTFYDFCSPSGYSTRLSTSYPQYLLVVGH